MTSELATASIQTDFGRFAGMKARAHGDNEGALREVGREFEAMFFQMMLKAARAGIPDDGMFGGNEMGMYQDLFDQQAAMMVAEQGQLGLADALVAQLSGSGLPPQSPAAPAPLRHQMVAPAAATGAPSPVAAAMNTMPAGPDVDSDDQTPHEFLARLRPWAQRTAAALGTDTDVLLAQVVLETGWGQHRLRHADGRDSYNVFAIKATPEWQGERVRVPTLEFRGGRWASEFAEFRAYPDQGAAFDDYLALIRDHPRYQQAVGGVRDGNGYAQALQRAGYATDPEYADKINGLVPRVRLQLAAAEAGAQARG